VLRSLSGDGRVTSLRARLVTWSVLAWVLLPGTGAAEMRRLVLDPAATEISFVLSTTVTQVRGRASLVSGEIRFDPAVGRASGQIVVDAGSTATGIGLRDRRMHRDVLEVARFPTIVFLPEAVEILRPGAVDAEILLRGRIAIHGAEHPLDIPARVVREGGALRIEARFSVPYVEWGMKDVQTLFLETSPRVEVQIVARATWVDEAPRAPMRSRR
jgi:polyisoprenoid-binding protein YceI